MVDRSNVVVHHMCLDPIVLIDERAAGQTIGTMETIPKPRLVFFQLDHRPMERYAAYLVEHTREHVRSLSHFFDVSVVSEDCDYGRICDRYEPQLTLFESGYQSTVSRRIRITNTKANPDIPKLGLYNADSWSQTRAAFLSDMAEWGIEVFFSICTTLPEYMPQFRDRMFIWPNAINPDVFRDYGLAKNIPVTLTGQANALYPWRRRIYPMLSSLYPCFITPNFNYSQGLASRAVAGEAYARALNASYFAPSCGTISREVVRKHFEIPGSRACLLAERSPSLEAAGFAHMQNCVFVTSDDIPDLLDDLMATPQTCACPWQAHLQAARADPSVVSAVAAIVAGAEAGSGRAFRRFADRSRKPCALKGPDARRH
jgi:hypothetical protein